MSKGKVLLILFFWRAVLTIILDLRGGLVSRRIFSEGAKVASAVLGIVSGLDFAAVETSLSEQLNSATVNIITKMENRFFMFSLFLA
jgi:hypothetical protein